MTRSIGFAKKIAQARSLAGKTRERENKIFQTAQ
jgi:hypothetical protein